MTDPVNTARTILPAHPVVDQFAAKKDIKIQQIKVRLMIPQSVVIIQNARKKKRKKLQAARMGPHVITTTKQRRMMAVAHTPAAQIPQPKILMKQQILHVTAMNLVLTVVSMKRDQTRMDSQKFVVILGLIIILVHVDLVRHVLGDQILNSPHVQKMIVVCSPAMIHWVVLQF